MVITSLLSIFLATSVDAKQSVTLKGPGMSLKLSVPTVVDGWKLKRSTTETSSMIIYEHDRLKAFGKPCVYSLAFYSKLLGATKLQVEKLSMMRSKPSKTSIKLEWRWNGWSYLGREDGTSPQGIRIDIIGEASDLFLLGRLTYPGPLDRATTNKLVAVSSRLERAIVPNGAMKAK